MSRPKLPRNATLTDLTNHMLTSIMPTSDDPRDCLMELGVRPTCAAAIVFGMIQKAARGDTSAAKFLKEMNGEGTVQEENTVTESYEAGDIEEPDEAESPEPYEDASAAEAAYKISFG